MFWTKLKLWFDRAISSNGLRQLAIPFLSFCLSLVVLFVILLLVNKGWCLVENNTFDATDSFEPRNILDAAFYHMYTNGGQNLFYSHFWGAIITLVGIIVIAILTSSITNFFEQRAKQYLSGETSYYFKNHVVVFGASDMLYSIIEQLNGQDYTYLVIQTGRSVEDTRREVISFLKENDETDRIVFFYGDRTSPKDLKRLHLKSAKEVYIIGDAAENENGESYRDAYNIDCLSTIKDVINDVSVEADLKNRKAKEEQINNEGDPEQKKQLEKDLKPIVERINNLDRLRCNVMFEYQTTFSSFQDSDIDYDTKAYINFEPFSFHEIWARKVFVYGGDEIYKYRYLDQISSGTYINKDSEQSVHLIIVGMSKMGIAMALEAAQVCHYPNYETKGKKTRISFIDPEADVEQLFVAGRLSQLKNLSVWELADASSPAFKYQNSLSSKPESGEDWLDVEWEFIKGRVEQESVRSYMTDAVSDNNHIVSVAICLPKSHQAIAAAIYLPVTVHKKCLQILVYQRISASLIRQLSSNKEGELANLIPFGMVDKAFSAGSTDDTKAMKVSYAYDKLYEELCNMKKQSSDGVIDLSKPDININWDNVDYKFAMFNSESYRKAPSWRLKVVNRWSSRFNANSISTKLRSVNAHELKDREEMEKVLTNHLELLMRVEHNRWNIEKLIAGYRPYSAEELKDLPDYKTDRWEDDVDALKKGKAHIDLCRYSDLSKRDYNNISYDEVLIRAIPYIELPD